MITSKTVIGAPAFTRSTSLQRGGQRVVGDQLAGDADALVEADQMRRGVDVDALARRLGDGAQEGAGAALAVGAGDVDHRRQAALGMAERRQQAVAAGPRLRSISRGMQRVQPLDDRRRSAPHGVGQRASRRLRLAP